MLYANPSTGRYVRRNIFTIMTLVCLAIYAVVKLSTDLFSQPRCGHSQNNIFTLFQTNEISANNQKKILIVSEARSGSSFLGDLLQQVTRTYYSYEPLVGISTNNSMYLKLIPQIFECRFLDLVNSYLKPVYWKVQYMRWNSILNKIVGQDESNIIQLFNYTLHTLICKRCALVQIKSIRYTLTHLWNFAKENDIQSIKVILLVRDPRAVMNSRYKLPWCYQTENCTNSKVLCQRMQDNIETLKTMADSNLHKNVVLVRYEDLVSNIFSTAQHLLRFVDIFDHSTMLDNWIRSHTSVDDVFLNPHSTFRNINASPFLWQRDLSLDELLDIQSDCFDVMHQLGYRPICSLDTDCNITSEQPDNPLLNLIENVYPMQLYSILKLNKL